MKDLIYKRFSKALSTYDVNAVAQKQIYTILEQMYHKLPLRKIKSVLEIGCGTGGFTKVINSLTAPELLVVNDICPDVFDRVGSAINDDLFEFICGDAESVRFPSGFDCIVSASTVQWFTDLNRFISHMADCCNECGVILFSSFGTDNFNEIKYLTGVGLDYLSIDEFVSCFESFFEIVEVRQEHMELLFDSPVDVLRHLKYTGVTATNDKPWSKKRLDNFVHEYVNCFSVGSKVKLTYHPICVSAIKSV